MKFQTVLLLLVAAAAMLEYCCATPADFGNSERDHERERRRTRGRGTPRGTGGDDEDDEDYEDYEDEDDDEAATQIVVVVNPGPNIVQQILGGISNFLTNSASALTNCVTQSPGCLPFDTAGCLICLGLAALAGIGK